MLLRQGAGKLKHLSVRTLWVQQAIQDFDVAVLKIPREHNHADVLCSIHGAAEFHDKMSAMSLRLSAATACCRRGGDAEPAAVHMVEEAHLRSTRRERRVHRLHALILVVNTEPRDEPLQLPASADPVEHCSREDDSPSPRDPVEPCSREGSA